MGSDLPPSKSRGVVAAGRRAAHGAHVHLGDNAIEHLLEAIGRLTALRDLPVPTPPAIAAAVLGGTSLFGGRGNVFPGTVLGAILIQTVENGLVIVTSCAGFSLGSAAS